MKETDRVNADRVKVFLEKIKKALWILKDKKIAVLGLAFKPETDDIREAPSIKVIRELLNEGANLRLYDSQARENMKELFPEYLARILYCDSPYQAAAGVNALLIITEWKEFLDLDLKKIKEVMANPIIIDGRNIYDAERIKKLGFEYDSVGRK